MASRHRPALQEGFVRPGVVLAVRMLILVAIGVGCYLLWVSLSGGAVAGCGPESSCDKVLHSRWSKWLGLPVSALALVVYGGVLAGTFWLRLTVPAPQQGKVWRWLIPAAVALIGAALWFVVVQGLILRSFCPFCMTAHTCGLLAAALLLWSAPFRDPPEKLWQQEKQVFVPPASARRLALLGMAGVVLLALGQFILTQKEYVVKMFEGKMELNLREVPIIGSPEAPHSVVSLFDYTCSHCRLMHGHLMEARQRFSNQLSIVSLPVPLCEKCNRTVKRTPREHVQACDYARIGLAVWRAKPKAQAQFDDWVFGPASPPALDEARKYASELAGPASFETALKDPWIDQQIQRDVSIYETNNLRGVIRMPQLIVGTNVYSGNFGRVEDLYRGLADNLGLR